MEEGNVYFNDVVLDNLESTRLLYCESLKRFRVNLRWMTIMSVILLVFLIICIVNFNELDKAIPPLIGPSFILIFGALKSRNDIKVYEKKLQKINKTIASEMLVKIHNTSPSLFTNEIFKNIDVLFPSVKLPK